ncbi:MAG TPA: hypothetical protein VFU95_12465 [Telluria sp.]|nr:hypothetical protein [Telluria sp.]
MSADPLRTRSAAYLLAALYLAAVLLCAGWALYADVAWRYSEQEHLLPSVVLFAVTCPSSLVVKLVFAAWPEAFFAAFIEDACLALCGLLQATVLFNLANRLQQARIGHARPPGR